MSDRIVHSDTCDTKPVIRGTSITVQTILEILAAGNSIEGVLKAYPALNQADLRACFDFAAKLIANHDPIPVRPENYFADCDTKEEIDELNQLAKLSNGLLNSR